jgi:hypothetical protein
VTELFIQEKPLRGEIAAFGQDEQVSPTVDISIYTTLGFGGHDE